MTDAAPGFIVHPTSRVRRRRAVVQLFGRLASGEAFLVEDERFEPYFFVNERGAALIKDEREIRIEMDPDRVSAYGLTLDEIVGLVPSENVNVSAGGMETQGVALKTEELTKR